MSENGSPSTEGSRPETDEEAFRARYFRKGLGLRKEVRGEVDSEWCSDLVTAFREQDFTLAFGDTTLRLAREFGFCYGVERSVDYAYETLKRFPDRRIVLTGEIIHNPRVNNLLRELGILFFGDEGMSGPDDVTSEDVVILPAFGVATEEFHALRQSGAVLVDTTCGSVLNVWKNVERYAKAGMTSLMHGKVGHEETTATVSRTNLYAAGHYIVVLDMAEAEYVARYIEEGGDREAFLEAFPYPKTSRDFDPDTHLKHVGVANQTTMLAGESLAIAKRIGQALQKRYGDADKTTRFRSFDTICSATQDRQDALEELLEESLDLLVVIGGYNSSNTGHLAEMAEGIMPAYHVHGAECLVSPDELHYKPIHGGEETIARGWLPTDRPVRIGVTAGASTPDQVIGAVVYRLLELRGETIPEALLT